MLARAFGHLLTPPERREKQRCWLEPSGAFFLAGEKGKAERCWPEPSGASSSPGKREKRGDAGSGLRAAIPGRRMGGARRRRRRLSDTFHGHERSSSGSDIDTSAWRGGDARRHPPPAMRRSVFGVRCSASVVRRATRNTQLSTSTPASATRSGRARRCAPGRPGSRSRHCRPGSGARCTGGRTGCRCPPSRAACRRSGNRR